MLKIIKKRLAIELSAEQASQLRQGLEGRNQSLIQQMRLEYLQRLGLDSAQEEKLPFCEPSDLLLGELYLPQPGVIFYLKAQRGQQELQAGVFTRQESVDGEEFFTQIHTILSASQPQLGEWQLAPELLPLEVEDAQVESAPPSLEEITAAQSLRDREARCLLEQIKEAGSIFLNKIEGMDREVLEERIHQFKELGLLSMDYAVLCRRTGQQILRVSDKATIDESSQKAFKCFICGSPIADEMVEEVLACTESGSQMLSNRTWLLVLVRGILADLGIPAQALKIYRNPKLPVQIFISINGLRYLFVLCTEAMSVDQSYLVGAHLAAYGLEHAVIISTERITTLMRSHLKQTNPQASFEFLDHIEVLAADLERIVVEQQRHYLAQELQNMAPLTKVDVSSLVLERMLPEPQEEAVRPFEVEEKAPVIAQSQPELPVQLEPDSSETALEPLVTEEGASLEGTPELETGEPLEEFKEEGGSSSKGGKKNKKHR